MKSLKNIYIIFGVSKLWISIISAPADKEY